MDQYIYYVYSHVDPRTDEIIYVGHGCRGRAWIHGSKKTCLRSQEHLNHLESLTQDGFVATDWVVILAQGMDKKSAAQLERTMIEDLEPTYNKRQGEKIMKVTADMLTEMESLRHSPFKDGGLSYKLIADVVGVSTMTAYRALTGATKNVKHLREVEL